MEKGETMSIYFNNCRGKDHQALYGKKAFYDLYATQRGPNYLTEGDECIVASRSKDGQVTFSYHTYSHESAGTYGGKPCRVFQGKLIKTMGPFSQKVASRIEPVFFNKLGHFNQWVVLER